MPKDWSNSSALQDTAEQFHILVDSVEEYAIYLLDPNGDIITWNTGAEKIKGYSAKEIVGKHFTCFYTADDVAAANHSATCSKPPVVDTFAIRACGYAKMDQRLKPKLSSLRFVTVPGKSAVFPKSREISPTRFAPANLKRKKSQRKRRVRRRTTFWQRSVMSCARR